MSGTHNMTTLKLTDELEREIGRLPACKDCLGAQQKFFDPDFRKYALTCAPESKEWDPCQNCLQIVVDFILDKAKAQPQEPGATK